MNVKTAGTTGWRLRQIVRRASEQGWCGATISSFRLLLVLTVSLGGAGSVCAREIVKKEDVASSLYRSGEVEAGRAEFRKLFADNLELCRDCYMPGSKYTEVFNGLLHRARAPDSSPEERVEALERYRMHVLGARVGAFDRCTFTLENWQKAEMHARLVEGVEMPEGVAREIVAAATALAVYPPILAASAESLRSPRELRMAGQVGAATQVYGRLLRYTVAFLRGTDLEELRPQLLEMARRYTDLPDSVQEFDRQNPSLEKIFRVAFPKATGQTEPPPTPRRRGR